MFEKIVNLTGQPMVRNAVALYGVTIANALLPLVLIPYLARVLKPHAWGMVLVAQTAAIWLGFLVEYGFSHLATREVARCSGQPERLRQIVAEVMTTRLLLCFIAAAVTGILLLVIPVFQEHPVMLIGAFGIAAAQGLSPLWYFQGIEKMRLPALLDISCRLIFIASVFLWIKGPEAAPLVLVYQAASLMLALVILLGIMCRQVRPGLCTPGRVWASLREAWHFFVYVTILNVYMKANSLILGLMASPTVVGFYGGPERLMRGVLSLTGPVNQVLYPRLAYLVTHDFPAARKTVRNGTVMVAALGACLGLSLALAAPWFTRTVFGPGYEDAAPVLRVLGLACPFSAVNSVMGVRWMFPLRLERIYNRILMCGAALDVILVVILFSSQGPIGAAWAVLSTEVFITLTVCVVLWRRRLNPFQKNSVKEAQVPS